MPAKLVRVINSALVSDINELFEHEKFDEIEELIQPFAPSDELSSGDFVWFAESDTTERYRNDNTFIWTGTKLINMDTKWDEYGTIPPEFVITDTDYDPMWWVNVNGRTSRLYLAKEIMKRIVFPADASAGATVSVQIGEKSWNVQIDTDDEITPEYITVLNKALQMGSSRIVFTDSSCSCDNPDNTFFVVLSDAEEEIELDDADAEEDIELDDVEK